MELWDLYDEKMNLIEGRTVTRGAEPIPDGMYHLVCDVIVRHTDGSYLIMQRDERKHFGGMWEATAGGSAIKGESPPECAVRELKEETGIVAENIKEVGKTIHHAHHTIYVEFFCETDCDKNSVTLQNGETQDYKWVTREVLVSMAKQELVTQRMQCFVKELQG